MRPQKSIWNWRNNLYPLDLGTWRIRQSFLKSVREFFEEKDFLEVTTPVLNVWSTPEPFLHPFEICSENPGSDADQ
ncbi:MAG: hypothetical protein KDK23_13200, partial [Leptospiraceae bacterium]|nr:hypothetical protein [Leptospiraceae bacterium]